MTTAPVEAAPARLESQAAARLGEALASLERLESGARAVAESSVAAVVGLYQEAVERLVALAAEGSGVVSLDDLAADPMWSGLLSLHGLHPVPIEVRVEEALDSVRPYLGSHSGDVRVHDLTGDVLTLELLGGCNGCPSSTATLRGLIESAVVEAVPEVAEVRVTEASKAEPGLIQITRRPVDEPCPFPADST